jgi:wyosine [tRNA(Phe)-imidazoG37] synthetase (radical SAM superfamily)
VKTNTPAECKLRCVYCESDIEQFVVASKKNKWYTADPSALLRADDHHLRELLVFAKEEDALAAGFHSRRASPEPRPPQRAGSKM